MQHSIRHLTSDQFQKLAGKPYNYNTDVVVQVASTNGPAAVELVKRVMPVGIVYGTYTSEDGLAVLHFEKVWHPATRS